MAMLTNNLLQERYMSYLEERIGFLGLEIERLRHQPELLQVARMNYERFVRCYRVFSGLWQRDMLAKLRPLRGSNSISIIASSATHAYLPLWENYPEIIELQIDIGIKEYVRLFGCRPLGFWLPEAGYFRGLDGILQKNAIRYFFLDAHGICHGDPAPCYREYAPIHTPEGVAVFGRDWLTHNQVWLKHKAYFGDPIYLDGDIGYELDQEAITSLTHQQRRVPTGIRYYNGENGSSRTTYNPHKAIARCEQHADHFVLQCQQWAKDLRHSLGRKPIIVAMYDTELFGHWWREGPTWLEMVIRKLSSEQATVRLVTPEEYLTLYPTNQVVTPSPSSWGYQGYSETWLMGRNHWIYPAVYQAIDKCREWASGDMNRSEPYRKALNQYVIPFLIQ
jgi:1,4-alpha-glucan branching enzyme